MPDQDALVWAHRLRYIRRSAAGFLLGSGFVSIVSLVITAGAWNAGELALFTVLPVLAALVWLWAWAAR